MRLLIILGSLLALTGAYQPTMKLQSSPSEGAKLDRRAALSAVGVGAAGFFGVAQPAAALRSVGLLKSFMSR